jgi:predicted RNA-binding Zn-ribbon protein involved in translation (DUF1610 family)
MVKYLEPERVKQDVTDMSMEKKLHLSEKGAVIECPKCGQQTSPEYIEGHDVFHCMCDCGYEWVE